MGWADADVRAYMREAGFREKDMLVDAIARGDGGAWFCHGGRKGPGLAPN